MSSGVPCIYKYYYYNISIFFYFSSYFNSSSSSSSSFSSSYSSSSSSCLSRSSKKFFFCSLSSSLVFYCPSEISSNSLAKLYKHLIFNGLWYMLPITKHYLKKSAASLYFLFDKDIWPLMKHTFYEKYSKSFFSFSIFFFYRAIVFF